MWKLLYIHILGYKIEFGFRQACDMIPKPKYKDKQVGYMACSTLLNENDDFLRLAINGVHVDLTSRNEAFECLALTFIGSVGGQEMAEALIPDIMKLLQQSGARPLVKKRAALCLLRMVRKTPVESQVINPDTFCSTLNNLLEEVDLGLLLSTVTLLGGILARSGPEGYETCQSRLIRILERLTVNTDAKSRVPAEYLYYGIPSPWVQSKCLRALQYYPVPEISSERNILNSILNLILIESPPVVDLGKGAGTNKSNAQHAILFEAIALTLTLEGLSPNLLNAAIAALGSLVNSKDANLKLLAMENLSRLSTNPQVAGIIRQNQAAFIAALKDPDVTIRKPALDLVVAVCDQAGSSELITDILKLIPSSEPSVREDLTKKVTTLIDKFSTTPQSYIEQTLGVMEKAGDVVGEEVWLKFVQRVGANPNDIATRKTAVRGVYEMLRRGTPASEPVACIAAYIFGDHGMMIRDEIRPSEQFRQINTLFPTSDAQAKTIIVFSAIKIHLSDVADASLKYDVTSLYERYSKNLDAEMQQRASQYLSQGAQPQANIDRVALPMPKWVAILTTKALASAASAPFPPAAPPAAPTAPTAPTHARAPSFNLLGSESVETSFSTGISSSSAAVPAAPAAPRAPLDLLSDLFSDSVASSAPAPAAPPAAAVNPFTAYSNPAYAPPAQSMAPVVAAAVVATNPFVSLPPAPAAAAPPPPGLPYSTSFGGAAYPPGGLAYPPAPAPAPVAPAAPPALPYATSFGAAAYPPVTAAPAPPPALPYAASFGAAAFPPAPAAFPPAPAAFPHAPGGFGGGGFDDPFGDNAFAPPALPVPILPPAAPIGDTKSWFSLLLHKERGILYEDQYIQVSGLETFSPVMSLTLHLPFLSPVMSLTLHLPCLSPVMSLTLHLPFLSSVMSRSGSKQSTLAVGVR